MHKGVAGEREGEGRVKKRTWCANARDTSGVYLKQYSQTYSLPLPVLEHASPIILGGYAEAYHGWIRYPPSTTDEISFACPWLWPPLPRGWCLSELGGEGVGFFFRAAMVAAVACVVDEGRLRGRSRRVVFVGFCRRRRRGYGLGYGKEAEAEEEEQEEAGAEGAEEEERDVRVGKPRSGRLLVSGRASGVSFRRLALSLNVGSSRLDLPFSLGGRFSLLKSERCEGVCLDAISAGPHARGQHPWIPRAHRIRGMPSCGPAPPSCIIAVRWTRGEDKV